MIKHATRPRMLLSAPPNRRGPAKGCATAVSVSLGLVVALGFSASRADAAVGQTISLGTASSYVVLGAETVTNSGGSTLDGSLGLWPGSSITGFPPGQVLAPGAIDTTNAAAQQAQSDLTDAYLAAAARSVDATTTADLSDLNLGAGVYAAPSKGALSLTGPLVLDGAGDFSSVFIFQTNSTLITGSASTVTLINGAQECNVFWQVGSSATLGTGSVFAGNILALTSIAVTSGVTVHGRALARTGEVTLDNDTFVKPTCAQRTDVGSTTTTAAATVPVVTGPGGTGTMPIGGPGIDSTLPGTGRSVGSSALLAGVLLVLGIGATCAVRRTPSPKRQS